MNDATSHLLGMPFAPLGNTVMTAHGATRVRACVLAIGRAVLFALLLAPLVAPTSAAQPGPVLAQMRADLAARRYAAVIEQGNLLLESPRAPDPEARMQLWQLLAAAYFPPERAAQQPDSAALPLAAMVRVVPDVQLDPASAWPGLDSLLEHTRTALFAVATRPRAEYIITPGAPAFLTVVASRPARFRLTAIALATGVAVAHGLVADARAASLPLRAQDASGDLFTSGAYRLDISAIDLASGDSIVVSHLVTATVESAAAAVVLPVVPQVVAPVVAPVLARPATPRETRARSGQRTVSRQSGILSGLAFAGAAIAIATVARPDGNLRSTFGTDPRVFIVSGSMLAATLITIWRRPPPVPARRAPAAPATRQPVASAPAPGAPAAIASVAPAPAPRARLTRVSLRLVNAEP